MRMTAPIETAAMTEKSKRGELRHCIKFCMRGTETEAVVLSKRAHENECPIVQVYMQGCCCRWILFGDTKMGTRKTCQWGEFLQLARNGHNLETNYYCRRHVEERLSFYSFCKSKQKVNKLVARTIVRKHRETRRSK